jgi:hypothetical protein
MKIQVRQVGGFAGAQVTLASADTSNLSSEAAAQLRDHLSRLSRLISLHPPSPGADRLQYEVDITEPGAQSRVLTVVEEDPDQPAVQEVISILELLRSQIAG